MDESVKNALVEGLVSETSDVYDALTDNLLGLEVEGEEKRGRGRPRKETEIIAKADKKSMAYGSLREAQKAKARKNDRLNPQPTEELQKV